MAWRSFNSQQIPFLERHILHNWFSEFPANRAENLSILQALQSRSDYQREPSSSHHGRPRKQAAKHGV